MEARRPVKPSRTKGHVGGLPVVLGPRLSGPHPVWKSRDGNCSNRWHPLSLSTPMFACRRVAGIVLVTTKNWWPAAIAREDTLVSIPKHHGRLSPRCADGKLPGQPGGRSTSLPAPIHESSPVPILRTGGVRSFPPTPPLPDPGTPLRSSLRWDVVPMSSEQKSQPG